MWRTAGVHGNPLYGQEAALRKCAKRKLFNHKKEKAMELLCKAMLYAAEKIARENGYILVAQEKRFADKDNFWGT